MKNITKYNFKNFIIIFLCLFYISNLFSQSFFSPANIKNIRVSNLSDSEIKQIKAEMDKQNLSIETAENLAISNGMSPTDFATLKLRLESLQPEQTKLNTELGTKINEKPIELDGQSTLKHSEIFGSELFSNPALSFEPNSSSATPNNYILGPGDELQLIIYGVQEFTSNPIVSKEGKITIPVVGQIFVNGLTIEAAKIQIKKACARVFKTLNSGQSTVSITLTKIRSIRITILGVRKPGNYSVSSLSTVFNALHIAGGPNDNGSYRNIELIRNNKIIKKIDIYRFIMTGDQSDNINLLENDVIRVPVYENRVKIEGKVKRPGVFELLSTENFNDLLRYCSGFDESAYKVNIKLVQNTEKELRILDLSENEYTNYTPKLGDVFNVSSILNRFENKVSIKGAVFRPDDYALTFGMTIKDLLTKADGLTEDAFKNRAILIREKDDLQKEIEHVDLNGNLELLLRKNDELIISSKFDFNNLKNVQIGGFVKKPGDYPYVEKLTLYDLIIQAGGLTEGASKLVEISSVIIKDEKIADQVQKSVLKYIEIDTSLLDKSKNIEIKPFDIVNIRKKPIFETQTFVSVIGEVMFPGNYVISSSAEKISSFIERAGGLKNEANIDAIYIIREVDRVNTIGREKISKKIPIDYASIINKNNSFKDIVLKPNDKLYVEKIDNTVKIYGSVYLSSEIPYKKGKNMKYYIKSVGGFDEKADKSRIYVIKPNGLGNNTKHFLFFKKYPKIESGSEIHVPEYKENPNKKAKMSIQEIASIIGVVGSLSGMTVAIINLLQTK